MHFSWLPLDSSIHLFALPLYHFASLSTHFYLILLSHSLPLNYVFRSVPWPLPSFLAFIDICLAWCPTHKICYYLNLWPKSNMGRKEFIWLTDSSPSSGKPRQEIQGRCWNRDHRGPLLTGFLPKACLACFLIQCRTTCLGGDTTHSGLGCTTSVINQENTLKTLGQSNEGISQLKFFLLNLTLSCVKLPEN